MSIRRITFTILAAGAALLACAAQDPSGLGNPRGLAQPHTSGPVYYVSPTGDDDHSGTLAQPWCTIQHAADTLVAGDTVYVRAGTYHERVVPRHTGSAGQAITYAAYPGETATIDGTGVTVPTDEGLFYVAGLEYIRIAGLRIAHSAYAGILLDGAGYVIVEDNHTYDTASSGIGVWNSHHVTLDGNEVELACHNGMQESLTIAGTDTFEVRDNHVHNGVAGYDKEGICIKDGSRNGQVYRNHVHHTTAVGIYVDAWDKHTYNIQVYQNVVHDVLENDSFALASETGGLLENVWVVNNVGYHNRFCGLVVTVNGPGDAQGRRPMKDVYVINNTFYDNGWETWGGGIAVDNPDAENVVVRNNIVSQNLYFQLVVDPGVPTQQVMVDHNLIHGYRGTEGEIRGDDYVEGDPLFASPAGANFRLQPGSPAIDVGSVVGAPGFDFEGQARPAGAGVDIGADEYVPFTDFVYLPLAFKD